MDFIDLKTQFKLIESSVRKRIDAVLAHGQFIMGPEINELEQKLAEYVGVKHCLSCSSGTDALLMPLMAKGIGPGDAILTTPFTFVATAEVISLLGATPIFVDIDPVTFNIDPKKLEAAIVRFEKGERLTPKSPPGLKLKGVLPVDIFGLPADYDEINRIAAEHGLFVLEDAAQSFGGMYKGRMACSLAEVAATSFFPAKPLGCYGDGGAVFTNNDDGLRTATDLQGKGVDVVAVIDSRQGGDLLPGIRHLLGAEVIGTSGKLGLTSIAVRQANGRSETLTVDALGVSGGWNPNVNIHSHHRSRPAGQAEQAGQQGVAQVHGRLP